MFKYRILASIMGLFILVTIIAFYEPNIVNVTATNSELDKESDIDSSESNSTNSQNYDVVVVGGDPEGVAAAVAAARNGANTILVEERDGLGGLLTYGMLNQVDLGYDKDRKIANQGIFMEWFEMVGGKGTFNAQEGKDSFMSLIENEENITLSLNTKVTEVIKENQQVTGIVTVNSDGVENVIYAKKFIDSTADADFAVKSGVQYFIGQEDIGVKERMCATLVMVLEDVNWNKFKKKAKDLYGGGTITDNIAWGFANVRDFYQTIEENTKLRGLNVGRQNDGIVTINALQIFGVDGLDENSKKEAIETGKREIENFVKFLRENMPGFEKAKVAYYPSELYIRETRHIIAEYQLPITDLWENKDHWDSIAIASYPCDVQATSVNGYGYYVTNPIQYSIPFRSLIPKGVDSLLVASKASGYSSLAAGSARTVPIGMSVGEAAGTAAAISINHDIDFLEMSTDEKLIDELQKTLIDQGALLYLFDLDYPYKGEWYYPAIKKLLPYGVIIGGYDNDLKVDEPITEYRFQKLIAGAIERSDNEKLKELVYNNNPWKVFNKDEKKILLTRDRMVEILLNLLGQNSISMSPVDLWEYALSQELIDEEIYNRITENRDITNIEGIYIVAYILDMQ